MQNPSRATSVSHIWLVIEKRWRICFIRGIVRPADSSMLQLRDDAMRFFAGGTEVRHRSNRVFKEPALR